jgi:hypothetical protein
MNAECETMTTMRDRIARRLARELFPEISGEEVVADQLKLAGAVLAELESPSEGMMEKFCADFWSGWDDPRLDKDPCLKRVRSAFIAAIRAAKAPE